MVKLNIGKVPGKVDPSGGKAPADLKAPEAVAPTAPQVGQVVSSTPQQSGGLSPSATPTVSAVDSSVSTPMMDSGEVPIVDNVPTVDTSVNSIKLDLSPIDLDNTTFKDVEAVDFVGLNKELSAKLTNEPSASARQQITYDVMHNTVTPHLKELGLSDIHRHFDDLSNGVRTIDSYSPKQQVALKGVSAMYKQAYRNQVGLIKKYYPKYKVGNRGEWYYPHWTKEMNQSKIDLFETKKDIWGEPETIQLNHFRASTGKVGIDEVDTDPSMMFSVYASAAYNNRDVVSLFARRTKEVLDEMNVLDDGTGNPLLDEAGQPVIDEIDDVSLEVIATVKEQEQKRMEKSQQDSSELLESIATIKSEEQTLKEIEANEREIAEFQEAVKEAYGEIAEEVANGDIPAKVLNETPDPNVPKASDLDFYRTLGLKKPTKAEIEQAKMDLIGSQTQLVDNLNAHNKELDAYLANTMGIKITSVEAEARFGKGYKNKVPKELIDNKAKPIDDQIADLVNSGKVIDELILFTNIKQARQKQRDIWHAERMIKEAMKDPDLAVDAETKVLANRVEAIKKERGIDDIKDLLDQEGKIKTDNEYRQEAVKERLTQIANEASWGEKVRKVFYDSHSTFVSDMMFAKRTAKTKSGEALFNSQHIIYAKEGAGNLFSDLERRSQNVFIKMNGFGGRKVEIDLWKASGVHFVRQIPAMRMNIAAEILETQGLITPNGEFDLAVLGKKTYDLVNDSDSLKGMGNMMLTSSQKRYLADNLAQEIVNLKDAYENDVAYIHAISFAIERTYRAAMKHAVGNIIDQGMVVPRKVASEMDTKTGEVYSTYDRMTENILQDIYDVIHNDMTKTPKFVRTIQKLMYSSALGGITRGSIQNLTEPLTMMTVSGYDPKIALASVSAMSTSTRKEYMDKYGQALGLNHIIMENISGEEFGRKAKGLVDGTTSLSTIPFRKTQEMAVLAQMVAEEHILYKKLYGKSKNPPTLKEAQADPDFVAQVINNAGRHIVMSDSLSVLRIFRDPYMRMVFMFVPYTMKHWGTLRRIYNDNMAEADTPMQEMLARLKFGAGLAGSKSIMAFIMATFGLDVVNSVAANPFNILDDRISPLDEEDRNFLDNLLVQIPMPIVVNAFMDVYYAYRKEQVAQPGLSGMELMQQELTLQKMLFGGVHNLIPAWGTINRTAKNLDAWAEGKVRSMAGNVKFETDMDLFNTAIALISGQNATRAGKIYSGLFDPIGAFVDKMQRSEGDVMSRLGSSVKAVYDEMDKLINENHIGGVLAGGVEAMKSILNGKGYEIFNVDEMNQVIDGADNPKYREWRSMVTGEYGAQFTGRDTLDDKVWGQEVKRLQIEYDKVSTKIEKLNGLLMSNNKSPEEKAEIEKQIQNIKDEYDKKFSDLVQGYSGAGHMIDEAKRNQLKWLAGYGEETPNSDNDTADRQAYINRLTEGLRIAKEDQDLSTASSAQSLKAGRDMAKELGNNQTLKRLRKEALEATDDIWDRANKEGRKPSSAEYKKMNDIASNYMAEFDKHILPLLNKNGGNMLLNYDNIVDLMAKYAIIPRSDWAEYTYVNKKGKTRTEYLSTGKKYPHVQADVKSLFQQRYGYSRDDKVIMGGQSSIEATRELSEAYRMMHNGNPAGRVYANRLYQRYLNGTRQLSETQADQLREMLNLRTY